MDCCCCCYYYYYLQLLLQLRLLLLPLLFLLLQSCSGLLLLLFLQDVPGTVPVSSPLDRPVTVQVVVAGNFPAGSVLLLPLCFWQGNSRRPLLLLLLLLLLLAGKLPQTSISASFSTCYSSAFLLRVRCSQTGSVLSHSPHRPFPFRSAPTFTVLFLSHFPFSFRLFFSFSFPLFLFPRLSLSSFLLSTVFLFPSLPVSSSSQRRHFYSFPVPSPSLSVFYYCNSSSSSSCSSPHYLYLLFSTPSHVRF